MGETEKDNKIDSDRRKEKHKRQRRGRQTNMIINNSDNT